MLGEKTATVRHGLGFGVYPMTREIELVVDSAQKGCRVIEDGTGILWNLDDLVEAWSDWRFQMDDAIAPPDGLLPTGPEEARSYRVFGRTAHFLIFAPDSAEPASQE
jgi:hypothetical protein